MDEADRLNSISEAVIGAAIEVHRALGPGLLESAYQACLAYELEQRGLAATREVPLPVVYGEVTLNCGYRLDLVVENAVVIEVKAVDKLVPIHEAQLLSYLKLSDRRLGLLINFHVTMLRDGLRRVVNRFPDRKRPVP